MGKRSVGGIFFKLLNFYPKYPEAGKAHMGTTKISAGGQKKSFREGDYIK